MSKLPPSNPPSETEASGTEPIPMRCMTMLLNLHDDGRGDLAKEIAAGWAKEHQEYLKRNQIK